MSHLKKSTSSRSSGALVLLLVSYEENILFTRIYPLGISWIIFKSLDKKIIVVFHSSFI